MLKKIGLFTALALALLLSAFFLAVYNNNQETNNFDVKVYKTHLEKSIAWLKTNKQKIVLENNAMLWWMIYESHKISHDPELAELLKSYFNQHPKIKSAIWGPLFNGRKYYFIDGYSLSNLPYYNQHFIYSLHCANDLAEELPVIAQQNKSDFCLHPNYFYRPACITHQLMGINFLNQNRCINIAEIETVINDLQQDIVKQMTWDIRVVDVYLQRVMMLLITGAQDEVKPIWIQQILNHQLRDGGWGNFDALFKLWGDKSVGFSSRVISIRSEKSSFHATAQAVYILTWLTHSRNN